MSSNYRRVCALLIATGLATNVHAQNIKAAAAESPAGAENDIIVTATKQVGTTAQQVPLSITAFGQQQLERSQLRNVNSLSVSVPNVQLGNASSAPGTMNFAVRGLGTTSQIASVDPQVGLFVDGVYVGLTVGAITDLFDTEAIEVLRGPQGVLFGKNVTGGAILVRTTAPKNSLYVDANASIETGLNYTGSAVISGPIIKDVLAIKVAGYYNKDEGWFKDAISGDPIGGSRTWVGRLALRFTPNDAIDITARYEHGDLDSDQGIPVQNITKYPSGFKMENSGDSYAWSKWNSVSVDSSIKLGSGTLTNIAGWRSVDYESSYEVDSLKAHLFQAVVGTKQSQFSDELRYSNKFGAIDLTTGAYYFTQNIQFLEAREQGTLANPLVYTTYLNDGGTQKQHTYGIFGAVDWHLSDTFTINLGARYTKEMKRVGIATLGGGAIGTTSPPCVFASVHSTLMCNYDFSGKNTSNGFTPKVGFQWKPDGDTQVYGSWSIGLRGGGFSFRNTKIGIPPGPYQDEKQYALELGVKTDLDQGRVRLNLAIFHSKIHNLQRDRVLVDPVIGTGQITDNVGNATYQGAEAEATVRPLKGLTLTGYVGIVDAHYDKLTADLSGDGVINDVDRHLDLTRVSPFSWGGGATYEHEFGAIGTGYARVNYGYKDRQAFLDNNLGYTSNYVSLDGSVGLTVGDRWTVSVYGKNLSNHRNATVGIFLPASFGGPFQVLEKGRVIGASIRFKIQ
jgi:iron complex outermembrane receptor protein